MKVRFLVLLTILMSFGLMTTYGCLPGQKGFYTSKDKKEKKGYLGVNIDDVTRRLAERKDLVATSGAYVTSVVRNSPAEDAGIEKGDVILKYNGDEVEDSDELTNYVRKTKPGSKVEIVVERDKVKKTLTADIEKLKESNSFSFNFDDDDFLGHIPDPPRINVRPRVRVFTSSSTMHGLSVEDLNKQLAEYLDIPGKKGAFVTEVKKNSDADKAGIKAGDVITKIGSANIWSVDDLREEFSDADDGDELNIEIYRKGKQSSLKMKVEKEEDDDWSYHYVPNGTGYHYYNNYSTSDKISHESLRRLKRQLKENLRDGLQDTKKELKRVKEKIKNELLRM